MADISNLYRELLNDQGIESYIPPLTTETSVPKFDPAVYAQAAAPAITPVSAAAPNPMAAPSIVSPSGVSVPDLTKSMPLFPDNEALMRALGSISNDPTFLARGNSRAGSSGSSGSVPVSGSLADRVAALEGYTPKAE